MVEGHNILNMYQIRFSNPYLGAEWMVRDGVVGVRIRGRRHTCNIFKSAGFNVRFSVVE